MHIRNLMALKKSDLYRSLWQSCDELRGPMEPSQYKDYVLVMLFIKYVSDKYSGQPFAPVSVPEGASFRDLVQLKGKSNIGELINVQIIEPLESANKLTDFPDFDDSSKLGSGPEKVERLTNLIAIFENPELDFSKNRADGDDILGDAYEYLMRNFATESGKKKGQFYTPAEVSRIMAKLIGISSAKVSTSTTVYDPTCGSGSLLLKVADEAAQQTGVKISLYGQENEATTAGLARMNMFLHDAPQAEIVQGNTITEPKFRDQGNLKTFDFVVANPPFSDKRWSVGIDPDNDAFERFQNFGVPPKTQGDYAYLLHIIRSMKSQGKGAVILPHGVLFRGNAEATIRKNLIESGIIKSVVGLPPNLFFGTGIPACILVLDKEGAPSRDGILMIDGSRGFVKDGNKNRLRERDVHKLLDVFESVSDVQNYSRYVPIEEIRSEKNSYNLNISRYIEGSDAPDIHDLEAHIQGGVPSLDVEALERYWRVFPTLKKELFTRETSGFFGFVTPTSEISNTVNGNSDFRTWSDSVEGHFEDWFTRTRSELTTVGLGSKPREIIKEISESLLKAFDDVELIDKYDVYQELMSYWNTTLQDDLFLIANYGWVEAALPREIKKIKDKNKKEVWPDAVPDYLDGKQRFRSELISRALLVNRYFAEEQLNLSGLEASVAKLEVELETIKEEHAGDEGFLIEFAEIDGEKIKFDKKSLVRWIKDNENTPERSEELSAANQIMVLMDAITSAKSSVKHSSELLSNRIAEKFGALQEAEVIELVVDSKWKRELQKALNVQLRNLISRLDGRLRELSTRYSSPLSQIEESLVQLSELVRSEIEEIRGK